MLASRFSPCWHGVEAVGGVAGGSLLTRGDVRCKLADRDAAIFMYIMRKL